MTTSSNSSKQSSPRMVLLTLYVTQSQLDALRRQSERTGVSVSRLIRDRIDGKRTVKRTVVKTPR